MISWYTIPSAPWLTPLSPPPHKQNRLGAPFAAFQAATAGDDSSAAADDEDDEDYSDEDEESEEESEDEEEDESEESDAGPSRRRGGSSSSKAAKGKSKGKGKGTPASSMRGGGGASSSAATTPTARLFSPATPYSAASSSANKKGSGSGSHAFSNDEASVGSGAGGAAKAPRADGALDHGRHIHNTASFKWLWAPERRDADKRRPEDPLYNPRTLFVPPTFLQKETPAMRQWWEFKARNFDTILFFKVRLSVGRRGQRGVPRLGCHWFLSIAAWLAGLLACWLACSPPHGLLAYTLPLPLPPSTVRRGRWASSTRSSTWTQTWASGSSTSPT